MAYTAIFFIFKEEFWVLCRNVYIEKLRGDIVMEIYFSINDRETILRGDIEPFQIEYSYKKMNDIPIYEIFMKKF